jgi:hypothetical protein
LVFKKWETLPLKVPLTYKHAAMYVGPGLEEDTHRIAHAIDAGVGVPSIESIQVKFERLLPDSRLAGERCGRTVAVVIRHTDRKIAQMAAYVAEMMVHASNLPYARPGWGSLGFLRAGLGRCFVRPGGDMRLEARPVDTFCSRFVLMAFQRALAGASQDYAAVRRALPVDASRCSPGNIVELAARDGAHWEKIALPEFVTCL